MHFSLVGNVVYSILIVIKHVFTKTSVNANLMGSLLEHIELLYNQNSCGECTLHFYDFNGCLEIANGENE